MHLENGRQHAPIREPAPEQVHCHGNLLRDARRRAARVPVSASGPAATSAMSNQRSSLARWTTPASAVSPSSSRSRWTPSTSQTWTRVAGRHARPCSSRTTEVLLSSARAATSRMDSPMPMRKRRMRSPTTSAPTRATSAPTSACLASGDATRAWAYTSKLRRPRYRRHRADPCGDQNGTVPFREPHQDPPACDRTARTSTGFGSAVRSLLRAAPQPCPLATGDVT